MCLAVLFCMGCGKPGQQPHVPVAGYKARLAFSDGFELGLTNWTAEGKGTMATGMDSTLTVSPAEDTVGVVIWSRPDLPENFQIEYEAFIPDTPGTHFVYFCAGRADRKTIGQGDALSPAAFNDYLKNQLNSYVIACHCYDRNGHPVSGSRLRKTPGNLLLAGNPTDPCRENRRYLIDVVKTGSRIQFFVDGTVVHDVRDRGGFGPVYEKGKMGLAVQGRGDAFRCIFKSVRVFGLEPQ
jgi:hypothetical protein